VPAIHFGTGKAHLLESMAAAGGDVIGLDWRAPLDQAWERVGLGRGVQGNLDPAALLGPWERVESRVDSILAAVDGGPGHIFNLGHGVLPDTDPAVLRQLRELVYERPPPFPLERRGHPDGVRIACERRGHPSLPQGHPRRTTGLRGGRGGADGALPTDRRLLAPGRGHQAPARRARARAS
jgi:Uroporphyrinogen decarboxylase (URO-D)